MVLLCLFSEGTSKVSLTDLLQFITGAHRIPPLGFTSQITIDFYTMQSARHYPTVSTCDMRLWLPRGVNNVEDLQELMEEAVVCAHGFGKC